MPAQLTLAIFAAPSCCRRPPPPAQPHTICPSACLQDATAVALPLVNQEIGHHGLVVLLSRNERPQPRAVQGGQPAPLSTPCYGMPCRPWEAGDAHGSSPIVDGPPSIGLGRPQLGLASSQVGLRRPQAFVRSLKLPPHLPCRNGRMRCVRLLRSCDAWPSASGRWRRS